MLHALKIILKTHLVLRLVGSALSLQDALLELRQLKSGKNTIFIELSNHSDTVDVSDHPNK